MTDEEFRGLKPGDIVKHTSLDAAFHFVVTANFGSRVTAVKTADLTNPAEWVKVERKRQRKKP